MLIRTMFQRDISREINGVVKVMQMDDDSVYQELSEYVITRELRTHFADFFGRYAQSIDGTTKEMGVWISGFFGSGKSHFLKILSYLLDGTQARGIKAIDYFRDKVDDPMRYAEMRRCCEAPTETILFNIDAQSPMGRNNDSILRVFAKVFNMHCGFYGEDLKVARFERFLAREGKLDAFKASFQRLNGDSWERGREAFSLWEDDVVAALTETAGISENAARNWFNGEETAEISIHSLVRDIRDYMAGKGANFRLVFLVDEIGQYIGDNSALMLSLQTFVEELGVACAGKAWVVVTSQEDIDKVTSPVHGNDFSKIQGRFRTRLSLSSASVDEVIKRRLLAKTSESTPLLKLLYQQNASSMKNLFTFSASTVADLKGYSGEDEFCDAYPYVPYQFRLLQDVLVQIRRHGAAGAHMAGGERSMLSAFQEAAQKIKDREEGSIVPFQLFYDSVHTFLSGSVRRVIDRASEAARHGDGLQPGDVDVVKLLFLARNTNDSLPCNLENLSTLMISGLRTDKVALRKAIQESLDRLVKQNYASRNGETYLFLTDEEQDINREIRNTVVDSAEVTQRIGQIIFADIYPAAKYRYGRYDFSYDKIVDEQVLGSLSSDIRLRMVSVVSDFALYDAEAALTMKSKNGEAIVLLSGDTAYYAELEEGIRIERYIRQRNVAQLPEAIRKIITNKQSEAKDHERRAQELLKEAILKGKYFVAGEQMALSGTTVREKLDAALKHLVESVYFKLDLVTSFCDSDADILAILNATHEQESIAGAGIPNGQAMHDILQYMEIQKQKHLNVTMSDIQRRYQGAPYGWREIDIAALVAALIKAQRLQLQYGGATVLTADRRIVDLMRKRTETEKTLVKMPVKVSETELEKARKNARDVFGMMDFPSDENGLCEQLFTLLSDKRKENNVILSRYAEGTRYPGRAVAEKGEKVFSNIISQRGDNLAFLTAFNGSGEELMDWAEDFKEVDFFFRNQKLIFDQAAALTAKVSREMDYFTGEEAARQAVATAGEILAMDRPYRRVQELPTLMQTVNAAYGRVNELKREHIETVIVKVRGDIHTLAGDEPELRDRIRDSDAYLETRKQAAMDTASPIELDAMVTQIYAYKERTCREMEKYLASRGHKSLHSPDREPKVLRRYEVFPQMLFSNEADVDAYADTFRRRLKEELRDGKMVQLD